MFEGASPGAGFSTIRRTRSPIISTIPERLVLSAGTVAKARTASVVWSESNALISLCMSALGTRLSQADNTKSPVTTVEAQARASDMPAGAG